jgi:dephospho-CoA kinase
VISLRVGLTGGIASGKSTVGQALAGRGALVLDGDRLAHEVIAPGGPAHAAVVQRFGTADRARLGTRVFADPAERQALEAIVHPAVLAELARRIAGYAGPARIAVFEAALIVEAGAHERFDRLIVVHCSAATQLRRLVERGLSPAEAQARIDAQAPAERKLAVADFVIDTEDSLGQTQRQVDEVWGPRGRRCGLPWPRSVAPRVSAVP